VLESSKRLTDWSAAVKITIS